MAVKFKKKIRSRKHGLAAIVALTILALYGLPHILVPQWQGNMGMGEYHPYSYEAPVLDDIAAYGSRVREVIDGHFADGDAYVAEYKNHATAWGNLLIAIMIGFIPYLIGLTDPTYLFVLFSLIGPVGAFLMLYALVQRMYPHAKRFAVLLSLTVTIFPNILIAIRAALADPTKLHPFTFVATAFDPAFTRTFIPSPGFIMFFAFLYFTYRALVEHHKASKYLAGILLGILFYVYFYYSVYAAFMVILLTIFSFIRERRSAVGPLTIGVVGLVVSIPYFAKTYALQGLSYYETLSERVGLVYGRTFDTSSLDVIILSTIMLSLAFVMIKNKEKFIYIAALMIPMSIVVNIQLILGFNPQPDHWGSRVNVYMLVLSLGVISFAVYDRIITKKNWTQKAHLLELAAITLLLTSALHVHLSDRYVKASEYTMPVDILESYEWINDNTEPDSVVVSNSTRTTAFAPFLSHANVYVPLGCYTVASHDEILDRYNQARVLFDTREDFHKNNLDGDYSYFVNPIRGFQLDPLYALFCDTFRTRRGGRDYSQEGSHRSLPDDFRQDFIDSYNGVSLKDSVTLPYRADYIYNGPFEKFLGRFDADKWSNIELVYSKGRVDIYRILDEK